MIILIDMFLLISGRNPTGISCVFCEMKWNILKTPHVIALHGRIKCTLLVFHKTEVSPTFQVTWQLEQRHSPSVQQCPALQAPKNDAIKPTHTLSMACPSLAAYNIIQNHNSTETCLRARRLQPWQTSIYHINHLILQSASHMPLVTVWTKGCTYKSTITH